MKYLNLSLFVILFIFSSSGKAQVLVQNIHSELSCVDDIHVEGDKIYAALSNNKIQIYDNNVWSSEIELLDDSGFGQGITVDTGGVVWYSSSKGLFSYDDGVVEHFTRSNSNLPTTNLKGIHLVKNNLWLITNGKDIIRKDGTEYVTMRAFANPNVFISDSETTPNGKLVVGAFGGIVVVTDTSSMEIAISGTVQDIFPDHEGNLIISTDRGIRKYFYETDELVDLSDKYGDLPFVLSGIDMNERFYGLNQDEGKIYYKDTFGVETTFALSDIDEPNFESFFLYKDSLRTYGLNVNGTTSTCYVITTLAEVLVDNDNDGVFSTMDCDDNDPDVNPNKTEIAYNGKDDDCDPSTLDDDLDQDGYDLAEDCNDTNFDINPGATEIPNNGIDEDCMNGDLVTTSIFELASGTISIYPNPTADLVYITNSSELSFELRLLDISGKELLYEKNTPSIDLSLYAPSVYFLHLTFDSGKIITSKVLLVE